MSKSVPPLALPQADEVRLMPAGLLVGHELVPLRAAALDYFQLERDVWRDVLGAVRALGFRLVEVRVPWNVHEREAGQFDFASANLNLRDFLLEAARFGLYAIVRLGPRLDDAFDLAFDGLPRRIAWDPDCHAFTQKGNPLVMPRLLHAFPEPSWFSSKYMREVQAWFGAAGQALRTLIFPHGPVVWVEIGSGHASQHLTKSLGDFHPDALISYRDYLRARYVNISKLRAAHACDARDFLEVTPPRAVYGVSEQSATAHLDWAAFQRQQETNRLGALRSQLLEQGLSGCAWMLDVQSVHTEADLEARALELIGNAAAQGRPSFFRLRAGFSLDEAPLSAEEQLFVNFRALALGAKGFSVAPIVPRPYWLGALLNAEGAPTPATEHWATLLEALERCQAQLFSPSASVTVVMPSRLTTLFHAADPLKPFAGSSSRWAPQGLDVESAWEASRDPELQDLTLTRKFLVELCEALRLLRVPYQVCSEEHLESAFNTARWTVVITTQSLDPSFAEGLRFALSRGAALSFGPFLPPALGAETATGKSWPLLLPAGREDLQRAIRKVTDSVDLVRLRAQPTEVEVVFHSAPHPHADGLLFVINPTQNSQEVSVDCPGFDARDALSREPVRSFAERLELTVPARTVRMLEVRSVL